MSHPRAFVSIFCHSFKSFHSKTILWLRVDHYKTCTSLLSTVLTLLPKMTLTGLFSSLQRVSLALTMPMWKNMSRSYPMLLNVLNIKSLSDLNMSCKNRHSWHVSCSRLCSLLSPLSKLQSYIKTWELVIVAQHGNLAPGSSHKTLSSLHAILGCLLSLAAGRGDCSALCSYLLSLFLWPFSLTIFLDHRFCCWRWEQNLLW